MTLLRQFGPIDIYLFDQLLRGRIAPGMHILDAGCGAGRNLIYLLRAGYDVCAVDLDPSAIEEVIRIAASLAPTLPVTNFRTEPIEQMSFSDAAFDVVLSNAVLHFARDDSDFLAMLRGMWRVLRPGGILFCRLASTIGSSGMGHQRLEGHRFLLADGSERYLVGEATLLSLTESFGGELLDPLKTTIVQSQRSMTTWVLQKKA
jgi:tellurite methyltransferase